MKRLLFALGAAALQTAKSPLHIRGLLSCEDTYGEGSQQCGPPDSGFCYTPSKGQTCCDAGYGYCPDGTYCAPVPGQCCLEGETLEECASAGSFDLPASATATPTPPSSPSLSSSDTTGAGPEATGCSVAPTGTVCAGETGSGPVLTSPGTQVPSRDGWAIAPPGGFVCSFRSRRPGYVVESIKHIGADLPANTTLITTKMHWR
ncbi:hypothetical protein VUR80DRAFT_3781 [Thermomyces stellatus]